MQTRQINSTSYPITFLMVRSVDHTTPATGQVPTVTLAKNGNLPFSIASGTVYEVGRGWYGISGHIWDRDTLGELLFNVTGINVDAVDFKYHIVPFNPFDGNRFGLTALPGTIAPSAIYYAEINFNKDTNDEYSVQWFRNTTPLSSGDITSPTIQVIKRSDGTNLVDSVSMDYVSISIGLLKKDEATNKTTAGEPYSVKVQATIDGSVKTWNKFIGRDA